MKSHENSNKAPKCPLVYYTDIINVYPLLAFREIYYYYLLNLNDFFGPTYNKNNVTSNI